MEKFIWYGQISQYEIEIICGNIEYQFVQREKWCCFGGKFGICDSCDLEVYA